MARRLIPLRKGPDGTHRLIVQLNPEGLGPISVVAEVRKGAVAVQITGGTEAGRAALHATLPELRRDLVEAGFGSCSLDIQQSGPQLDQGQQQSPPQSFGNAPHERNSPREHNGTHERRERSPERRAVQVPRANTDTSPHRALDLRV